MSSAERIEDYPVIEFDITQSGPVMSRIRQYQRMREQHPFVRNSFGPGFWVFTRLDLIREAYQDPELFSSTATNPIDPDPAYKWIPQMLDPPEHTTWRQLLAPAFSPGAMARLAHAVRDRCVEIIESFVDRGSIDFVAEFAQEYPTTIFLELMGLPLQDLAQFLHWEDEILHLSREQDPESARALTAMIEVMGYFDDLLARRRNDRGDDLVSQCLDWTIDGKPIPHDDLLSFCLLMFMAGLDTVTIQLTFMFWHLATHADDRDRIIGEPAIIPSAVEEFLRAYAFVPPARKVTRDVDFHGCPMKAGDMVLLPLCNATRDPEAFADANKVIVDRSPNNHNAFGAGPHRCLGAHLARRELRVALEEWHKRIPHYRVRQGFDVLERGTMFGIAELALEWQN
jgi:cytochrome P450